MSSPVDTQVLCRQCASVLPVKQGTQFITCEFCGTTNFVDKREAVLHYAVRDTINETDALAALRRWMAGNDTVKGLDEAARIARPSFEMFPMWMVRVAQGETERVLLEPAAATSIIELTDIVIPAADLEPYDHTMDDQAIIPTVPYETMKRWLAENHRVDAEAIREASLVHLPLFVFKYMFKERHYTAVVDAASSKVLATIYPSKKETPYFAIGSLGCLIYFFVALIPLGGYLLGEMEGLLIGILVYIIVAILAAIPIFLMAAYVSSKV